MKIEHVQRGGGLLVSLMPHDCYHLADACRRAAAEADEDTGDTTLAHLYDTLAAALEGYALAGAANGFMLRDDHARYTGAAVRRSWPADAPLGGAR